MLLRDDPASESPYSWLRLAHVCRLWRNIVLETPSLFSSIELPTSDPAQVAEFVRASMQTPLCIKVKETPGHELEWDQLQVPANRVASLTMLPSRSFFSALPHFPRMASFSCVPKYRGDVGWAAGNLLEKMPNLKNLEIGTDVLGVGWFSSSHSFPLSVQDLSLTCGILLMRVPLREVLEKVMNIPSLKTLEMTYLYTHPGPSPMTPRSWHLDFLSLSGETVSCMELLSYLRSADHISLRLDRVNDDGDVSRLPQILQRKLSPSSTSLTCELFLNNLGFASEYSSFALNSDENLPTYESLQGCDLSIEVDHKHFASLIGSVTKAFSSRLSLVTDCRVCLSADSNDITSTLCTFFGGVPSLTSLTWSLRSEYLLYNLMMTTSIPFFPWAMAPSTPWPASTTPLPSLQHLCICLEGRYENEDESDDGLEDYENTWDSIDVLLWHFVMTLRRRMEHGLHLRSLLIDASQFTHEMWNHEMNCLSQTVARLEDVVDNTLILPPRGL